MFGFGAKVIDETKAVAKAAKEATFRNLGHAAASLRKIAVASILTRKDRRKASPPGLPPHTRRGQLRRAIRYDVADDVAVIGPMASVAGTAGAAHEFGGLYKGDDFDRRPFMGPALDASLDRFAKGWEGSVHS